MKEQTDNTITREKAKHGLDSGMYKHYMEGSEIRIGKNVEVEPRCKESKNKI